jgi:hypothetical protein
MTEETAETEPTLVEKWVKDQQDWQRTWMEYFDSMVKNDEFLVHLGNAMRGSLLAGKPYPGTEAPEPAEPDPAAAAPDARIDEILHALHRLQGEITDLKMTVEDLAARQVATESNLPADPPKPTPPNPAPGDFERGEG